MPKKKAIPTRKIPKQTKALPKVSVVEHVAPVQVVRAAPQPQAPRTTPELRADFCEHQVHSCLFCGVAVRIGHNAKGEAVTIHDGPTCKAFDHCDDAVQFAMMTKLKWQADNGQNVRN